LSWNRVAVVSGGNRGIGREVCKQLAERGYDLILGSRELDKGSAPSSSLANRPASVMYSST
jgi:NAD(P)-dependent dehydrogenase (short-subunit alcohol dehydrogenase family)